MTKTKEALDDKGKQMSASYPAFSMAVLWNMNANDATTAALAFGKVSEIPLDGDGAARAAYRAMMTAAGWQEIPDAMVRRLRANHPAANTVPERPARLDVTA